MKIKELLAEKESTRVESVELSTSLRETAQKLLKFRIGALVVTDEKNHMMGIVSERDLIHVVANYDADAVDKPVSKVMTRSVITCGPEDEVAFVLRLMNSHSIRHIPVLDNCNLTAMVSIRELTIAYELLQIEANTDPLTELSNRRPFLKTLEAELQRARRFGHCLSVAMIDIDHFKRVNDNYGHDAGDKVLRYLSGLLIGEFRTIDLVGRLGGEEFAAVFPETDLAGAKNACERLSAGIETADIEVDGSTINITISIGISGMSSGSRDGSAVLKRADEMLYAAKRGGRNRIIVDGENILRT